MTPAAEKILVTFMTPPKFGEFTMNKQYLAVCIDSDLRLYQATDNAGKPINLATFGQGYTNGGHWKMEPVTN